MKQSILLAAVLAVFSTSPVFAGGSLFGGSDSDSDDTFSEDGAGAMYGGVSVGQSSDGACEANNTLIDGINATTQSLLGTSVVSNFGCPNTTAWKVYGGYKIAPNLAVEGAYVNFGDAESTATVAALPPINNNANPVTTTTSATGFGASGVASAPVTDEINLFGKMGFLAWEKENKASSTVLGMNETLTQKTDGVDLSLGAGAEYKIDENWGVRGEVEHFDGLNANLYSVGATFSTF
ncbi:outer membrane beta-barrel protein [Thiothrix nivea]|uniref:Outer membrane protein OmpA-like transmembrane domain-containing protein n=1 Tax=Thiothrix nivea (strain ATCC 35100 / DSM 5205 / JP2) TaxID=870187 RepID=A0A656H8S6_THINJ|nr:outer membrane beta-barrel protein [Thiothrix nivea]EIJ33071.1 hypothetical protein Thini_0418 [Thiothrix nivea DSM 5205]